MYTARLTSFVAPVRRTAGEEAPLPRISWPSEGSPSALLSPLLPPHHQNNDNNDNNNDDISININVNSNTSNDTNNYNDRLS